MNSAVPSVEFTTVARIMERPIHYKTIATPLKSLIHKNSDDSTGLPGTS